MYIFVYKSKCNGHKNGANASFSVQSKISPKLKAQITNFTQKIEKDDNF